MEEGSYFSVHGFEQSDSLSAPRPAPAIIAKLGPGVSGEGNNQSEYGQMTKKHYTSSTTSQSNR
jgi:hypothetical protein